LNPGPDEARAVAAEKGGFLVLFVLAKTHFVLLRKVNQFCRQWLLIPLRRFVAKFF
jgi:hypothetical protein